MYCLSAQNPHPGRPEKLALTLYHQETRESTQPGLRLIIGAGKSCLSSPNKL